MLDPLTAIALVGNIFTFIDFTSKVISSSNELYHSNSGLLGEHQEFTAIAKRLQRLNNNISRANTRGDDPNSAEAVHHIQSLQQIVDSCDIVAQDLIKALNTLQSQKSNRWGSVRAAIKSIWKHEEIQKLAGKLDSYRAEIVHHLLVIGSADNAAIYRNTSLLVSDTRELRIQITDQQKTLSDIVEILKNHAKCLGSRDEDELGNLSHKLEELQLQKEHTTAEQIILDSLYSPRLYERYNRIAEAHHSTFRWIFKEEATKKQSRCNFKEWLSTGSGLYWIAGKAGSGKSTLMKYISGAPETIAALTEWVGGSDLIKTSFYFWIAGPALQKTFLGLLHSLFYEIVDSHKELIPELFPWRWRRQKAYDTGDDPWSETEFLNAVRVLKHSFSKSSKICFFIDGLDEYDGDHEGLIKFIKELAEVSHLKFCVSSRPWNAFQDAFEDVPFFNVHELTQSDISQYARNLLQESPRWKAICDREPIRSLQLHNEICAKSSGVFLWVYLVVRSLRQGIRDGDRIVDLQKRLDKFPSELEDYFMHILDRLDPDYAPQAAQFFQMALQNEEPLFVLTYSFLGEESLHFGQDAPMRPWSIEETRAKCDDAERRLKSRCKDLLEVYVVKPESEDPEWAISVQPEMQSSEKSHGGNYIPSIYHYKKVGFLHRTVRDFLASPRAGSKLLADMPEEFECSHWMLQALLAQIKGLPHLPQAIGYPVPVFERLFWLVIQAFRAFELSNSSAATALFEECDQVLSKYCYKVGITTSSGSFNHWSNIWVPQPMNFFRLAAMFGLTNYVEHKLQSSPQLLCDLGSPSLLTYALAEVTQPGSGVHFTGPNVRMLRMILEAGEKPSEEELRHWHEKAGYGSSEARNIYKLLLEFSQKTAAESSKETEQEFMARGKEFDLTTRQVVAQVTRKRSRQPSDIEKQNAPNSRLA